MLPSGNDGSRMLKQSTSWTSATRLIPRGVRARVTNRGSRSSNLGASGAARPTLVRHASEQGAHDLIARLRRRLPVLFELATVLATLAAGATVAAGAETAIERRFDAPAAEFRAAAPRLEGLLADERVAVDALSTGATALSLARVGAAARRIDATAKALEPHLRDSGFRFDAVAYALDTLRDDYGAWLDQIDGVPATLTPEIAQELTDWYTIFVKRDGSELVKDLELASSATAERVATAERRLGLAVGLSLLFTGAALALAWANRRHPAPPSEFFAAILAEGTLRPKRRPWFKGWPVLFAGSALLTAATLVVLMSLLARTAPIPVLGLAASLIAGLVAPMFGAPGSWLWRRGKRSLAVATANAAITDPRPPVLYLRSFDDDAVTAAPVSADLPLSYRRYSEEEQLVMTLGRLGPVVAIGRPGEELPEVGAARFYVGDDAWQATVAELMAASRLVVLRAGTTPGLHWEMERAVGTLRPEQILFLVPAGQDGHDSWRASLNAFLPKPLSDSEASDSEAPSNGTVAAPAGSGLRCAISFDADWTPRVIGLQPRVVYPRTMQRLFYRRLWPVARQLGTPWRQWLPVRSRAAAAFPLKVAGFVIATLAVIKLIELFQGTQAW